jgi:hypothetical protein
LHGSVRPIWMVSRGKRTWARSRWKNKVEVRPRCWWPRHIVRKSKLTKKCFPAPWHQRYLRLCLCQSPIRFLTCVTDIFHFSPFHDLIDQSLRAHRTPIGT